MSGDWKYIIMSVPTGYLGKKSKCLLHHITRGVEDVSVLFWKLAPPAHKWPNNYKSVPLARVKYSLTIFCSGQDVQDLFRQITSVLTFPCLQLCIYIYIYMVALFFVGPLSFMNLLTVCGTPDCTKMNTGKKIIYPEYRTREDTACA